MPTSSKTDLYRKLPSVDDLLRRADLTAIVASEGLAAVTDAARAVLSRIRTEIAATRLDVATVDLALLRNRRRDRAPGPAVAELLAHPVINATGVILHTNLGRAPLAESALKHIRDRIGYSNLEFDLDSGERGERDVHVDRLFRKLLVKASRARAPAPQAEHPISPPSSSTTTLPRSCWL